MNNGIQSHVRHNFAILTKYKKNHVFVSASVTSCGHKARRPELHTHELYAAIRRYSSSGVPYMSNTIAAIRQQLIEFSSVTSCGHKARRPELHTHELYAAIRRYSSSGVPYMSNTIAAIRRIASLR